MKYRARDSLVVIPLDEGSMAVYDPLSGDTHFFEGTSYSIVKLVLDSETGIELDSLVSLLVEEYSASEEEIREDVVPYLQLLIDKKVIDSI